MKHSDLRITLPFTKHLKSLLMLTGVLVSGGAFAQLTGNYTIDPNQPASSTNYLDMTSAAADLAGTKSRPDGGPVNGPGVSGPVVFDFAKKYSVEERVVLAEAPGASDINTITFEGHGANIYYTGTYGDPHTLMFDGADYYILNDMLIQGMDADYAYVVVFRNSATYNVINGCTIETPNLNFFSSVWNGDDASAGIAFTTDLSALDIGGKRGGRSSGDNGYANTIQNCIIRGGEDLYGPTFGIFDVEYDGKSWNYNRFLNNEIYDFHGAAIASAYTDGEEAIGNNIYRKANIDLPSYESYYGIFMNYPTKADNKAMQVEMNKIHEFHGGSSNREYDYFDIFYSSGDYQGNSEVRIVNNALYNTSAWGHYGMYVEYPYNLRLYNNTVSHDNKDGAEWYTYGLYTYHYQSANNEIANNNIVLTEGGNGDKVAYYIDYYGIYTEHHNNGLVNTPNGWTQYGYNGNWCADINEWYMNSGDPSDISEDPNFLDPSNGQYECVNFNMNNGGADVGVDVDVNGNPRNVNQPDFGAYEITLDFKITKASFDVSDICAGYTENAELTIENNSDYTLSGVQVAVALNGNVLQQFKIEDKIDSHKDYVYTFPNPVTISTAGPNTLDIYIVADDTIANNIITRNIDVTPSPGGGVLSQKAGSKGIFSYKNRPVDVVAEGDLMTYEMTPPRKYDETGYGTDWTASVFAATPSGINPGSGVVSVAHGSTTEISFNSPAAFIDSTINISIVISDLQTGCDTTYIRPVIIAPKAKVSFDFPSVNCSNAPVIFENLTNIHSGGFTSEWDFGDGSDISDLTNPVHDFPGVGSYTVKLTATSVPYGIVTEYSANVVINEAPKANFSRVNACLGSSVVFSNTSSIGSGVLTYDWDFGDGSAHSVLQNPAHAYALSKAYVVTLKAKTPQGCENSVTKNVYTFAKPTAAYTAPATAVCANTPVVLVNNSTIMSGDAGSLWNFGDGTTSTNTNGQHAYTTDGVYPVKLKMISEFGCTDSITKNITIKPSPAVNFSYDKTCTIDPTRFTNNTVTAAGQNPAYTWTFSDGGTASTTNVSHLWRNKGTQTIRLSAVQANGCTGYMEKTVEVHVQPDAKFTAEDGCSGAEITFQNQTTATEGTIQNEWSFGDDPSSVSTESDPVHVYNTVSTRTFNVRLISTTGGCADTAYKTITISETPNCGFSYKNDYRFGSRGYSFTPDNSTYDEYTWIFGDGNTSSMKNPQYTYSINGLYYVKLKAKNAMGCQCEQTLSINVGQSDIPDMAILDEVNIFPNPNNGKFNVKIEGAIGENDYIEIYNVLGELVRRITVTGGTTEVDLSNESSGIYIVKVASKRGTSTKKVTVNNG